MGACIYCPHTYCYWLAGRTNWLTCGLYMIPQSIMFTIYSLSVGREKLLTQNLDVKTWRAGHFPVNRWRCSNLVFVFQICFIGRFGQIYLGMMVTFSISSCGWLPLWPQTKIPNKNTADTSNAEKFSGWSMTTQVFNSSVQVFVLALASIIF